MAVVFEVFLLSYMGLKYYMTWEVWFYEYTYTITL